MKHLPPPCPRCLALYHDGTIRREMVQPLPAGPHAPLAKVPKGKACCYDCASADAVMTIGGALTFEMARIATGNDRQEQYRLPGAPLGLVGHGIMRPSQKGDFEKHCEWLDRVVDVPVG